MNLPNYLLDKLKDYSTQIALGGLSLQGDDMYLIDVGQILGKSLLEITKNQLIDTAKSVVGNVVSDVLVSIGGAAGNLGGLVETVLNVVMDTILMPPWFYKFRINATTININRSKLQNVTNYGWGIYDLEYFGDDLLKIPVSGSTGLLMPPDPLPRIGITDVRLTESYIKLAHLEKFYKNSSQKLLFTTFGRVYFGYLHELTYKKDANNPRRIDYNFTFIASPYFIFDVFTQDFNTDFGLQGDTLWESISTPSIVQNMNDYGSMDNLVSNIANPFGR